MGGESDTSHHQPSDLEDASQDLPTHRTQSSPPVGTGNARRRGNSDEDGLPDVQTLRRERRTGGERMF